MDNVFVRSMFCSPPRVAGIQLRPFAPHHAMALLAFDNPLLSMEQPARIQDAVQAALICSDSYPQRLTTLQRFARSWRFRLRTELRCLCASESAVISQMEEYLSHYTNSPDVIVESGTTHVSGLPRPYRLVLNVALGCKGALQLPTIWETPFNELYCLQAGISESSGGTVTDGLLDQLEHVWAELTPEEVANMEKAAHG